MARQIMYKGGNHPTPVNCSACAADPRPRNCGGRTASPPCCEAGAKQPCDDKVIPTADKDRGKDYNHSTFLDIIIAGLIGLRAAFGDTLVIQPLADKSVTYFALDNVFYHGHNVSVAFDAAGKRYAAKGCTGLCVWVDGKLAAKSATLGRLSVELKK